ncbi:MAG: hypothetical protein AB1299_00045 [Thermoproteota archaeon]|jgi:hypothetical protein|nr:hypothetical protein [Candidatus Nitrosotenuis sp.]
MSAPRDWTRVTISMNIELNKRLKEKQYEMMKENTNVSFSKLINHVLEEGLRYGNLEPLKH